MKKYEILTETAMKLDNGAIVYRIRALRDFGIVKKGDVGGFVESESNLSQHGRCWVFHNAVVYGNALVDSDAFVKNVSVVRGNAHITDRATIERNSIVEDYATVARNGHVHGCAHVFGSATVHGNVYNFAEVYDRAFVNGSVSGKAQVFGNANIGFDSVVHGFARVHAFTNLFGDCVITNRCDVGGTIDIINSNICGKSYISGFAEIKDCEIYDSYTNLNLDIDNCTLIDAKIEGSVRMINSKIANSSISGYTIITNTLLKSNNRRINIRNAVIKDCDITEGRDIKNRTIIGDKK